MRQRQPSERLKVALQKIKQATGELTPEAVVQTARAKNHPLHRYFEWDDGKAAHAHRLFQARALIRSVMVVMLEPVTLIPRKVPFMVRDPNAEAGTQSYVETASLQGSDPGRQAMLNEMQRVLAALRRARDVGAVLGFGDEVETLIQDAVGLRQRVVEAA